MSRSSKLRTFCFLTAMRSFRKHSISGNSSHTCSNTSAQKRSPKHNCQRTSFKVSLRVGIDGLISGEVVMQCFTVRQAECCTKHTRRTLLSPVPIVSKTCIKPTKRRVTLHKLQFHFPSTPSHHTGAHSRFIQLNRMSCIDLFAIKPGVEASLGKIPTLRSIGCSEPNQPDFGRTLLLGWIACGRRFSTSLSHRDCLQLLGGLAIGIRHFVLIPRSSELLFDNITKI